MIQDQGFKKTLKFVPGDGIGALKIVQRQRKFGVQLETHLPNLTFNKGLLYLSIDSISLEG